MGLIKMIIVGLVLGFTVLAIILYLMNMDLVVSGVATANQSASVNVTNYHAWTETVNMMPWIGVFIILFIGGGGAIWLMIKL